LAHRRPLLVAVGVVAVLLLAGIVVFRPNYDTNDDPTMSFIVTGRVISQTPDEHMVFTHFLIGLLLKRLYLWAPAVPWYAVYLFSVHAAAHVALVYVVFKQRVGLHWFAVYLAYAAVVGLMLLTSLQFTTTAFVALQSGCLLGLFAFQRATEGNARTARRATIASIAFLVAAALIRWHVFMLFASLAIPAACVLLWTHRREKRLIGRAAGVAGFTFAGLVGLALANTAYYDGDPRWRDFYSHNELRARVNDLGWVYYSPETAHVFPQVGWTVNDLAMMQTWFYDDPAVYNAAVYQALLDAYPWQETMPRQNRLKDLRTALADDGHLIPLLALLPLAALLLGRNYTALVTLLVSCLWVCAIVLVATLLRKPPPARIYLPILSFPLGLTVFLGAVWPIPWRGKNPADTLEPSPPRPKGTHRSWPKTAVQTACVALAAIGVVVGLGTHYARGRDKSERSEAFYRELASIADDPEKLYIVWGASMPYELLRPGDNLQWLSNLRVLQWGWGQQCPFHNDMKLIFGIGDLARELADRPDVTLISDPILLPFLATYIREHHGREVAFERTGQFLTAVVTRAMPASPAVIASQENAQRK
jgi:hypothetical protein